MIINNKSKYAGSRSEGSAGTGLVEVVIASAILGTVIVSVISVYLSLARISLQNTEKVQSTFLLEEGTEAVRLIRDTSWTGISSAALNTDYHLRWQGGTWVATTAPQAIDEFTRTIRYSSVSRDGSFNILPSGGVNDSGTRKATVSVSWTGQAGTTSRSVDMYIFNTFND